MSCRDGDLTTFRPGFLYGFEHGNSKKAKPLVTSSLHPSTTAAYVKSERVPELSQKALLQPTSLELVAKSPKNLTNQGAHGIEQEDRFSSEAGAYLYVVTVFLYMYDGSILQKGLNAHIFRVLYTSGCSLLQQPLPPWLPYLFMRHKSQILGPASRPILYLDGAHPP